MKGVCAISIDDSRAFLSFGLLKKPSFRFLEEYSLVLPQKTTDLSSALGENAEGINQAIEDAEKRHDLKITKVFVELPQDLTNTKIITDIVPLRGKKKVSSFDINFIKKYIEDKFLDWDDYCIHNIALQFTTRGTSYQEPPYGIWAKKLAVKSLLVSIKDKVHKEIEDILDNLGRQFAGFTSSMVSAYAAVFTKLEATQVVMRCGYRRSNFVIRKKGEFIFSKELDFTLKGLIENLAKRFSINFALAEEVFERYISFKEIPYFKEVTIKKGSGYINLSTQTMNLFTKDYIRSEIANIFQLIGLYIEGDDFIFSFLGRLGKKEGFCRFLKDCLPCELATPKEQSIVSASFGCLSYSLSPFLELDYKRKRTLLQRVSEVYREYF